MSQQLIDQELEDLRHAAYTAHDDATAKFHKYACELPLGPERVAAFMVYQNVRLATRV
jgi:hypothetical protein